MLIKSVSFFSTFSKISNENRIYTLRQNDDKKNTWRNFIYAKSNLFLFEHATTIALILLGNGNNNMRLRRMTIRYTYSELWICCIRFYRQTKSKTVIGTFENPYLFVYLERKRMKIVLPMHLCGPPALNPARHCRNAKAARHGVLECRPVSSDQSSGPICANHMTENRCKNSGTAILYRAHRI